MFYCNDEITSNYVGNKLLVSKNYFSALFLILACFGKITVMFIWTLN